MIAFTQPWALLALAGIPLVIGLHLLRLRLPPVAVSGLFLWSGRRAVGQGGRSIRPLHQRASLWLECLAVLLAAAALADPYLPGQRSTSHLVLVVDGHWRMKAVDAADGQSAWERARHRGRTLIESLPSGQGLVTVIASGPAPRLLAGPAVSREEALSALAAFTPDSPRHDLRPALDLARDVSAHAPLVLLTDHDPGLPDIGMIATGRPLPTSGWAGVHRDGAGRIWLRTTASPGAPPRPWRAVDGESRTLASGTTAQAPGGLIGLPPLAGDLDLILDGGDPLTVDDRVRIPWRPPAPVRWRHSLAPGLRLTAAVERALAAAGAVPGGDDLEIGLGATVAAPGCWRVSLVRGNSPAVAGPFTARSGHPLVQGVDTAGLVIASPGFPLADEEPLWRAGTAAVLGLRRHPGRGVEILIHADWDRSTLERHPAWPVLWANVVQARRDAEPGPRQSSLVPGRSSSAVLPPGTVGTLIGAATITLSAQADGVAIIPPLTPGRWLLEAGDRRWPLAVDRLDPAQADLSQAATMERLTADLGRTEAPRSPSELALWLTALGLCVAAAWTARRREDGT